jgi:hypothetical protein
MVAPLDDVARHFRGVRPAIDRQAEGGFGDEGVARHHLERRAGGVGLPLVVARHHPHLAVDLDAHLRGAQHVARGMQRNASPAQRERLAIGVDAVVLLAQAPLQDGQALGAGVVATHAGAGVVAMAMREDGHVHGAPGVDVEAAGGAIQTFRTQLDDVGHGLSRSDRRGLRGRANHASVLPLYPNAATRFSIIQ